MSRNEPQPQYPAIPADAQIRPIDNWFQKYWQNPLYKPEWLNRLLKVTEPITSAPPEEVLSNISPAGSSITAFRQAAAKAGVKEYGERLGAKLLDDIAARFRQGAGFIDRNANRIPVDRYHIRTMNEMEAAAAKAEGRVPKTKPLMEGMRDKEVIRYRNMQDGLLLEVNHKPSALQVQALDEMVKALGHGNKTVALEMYQLSPDGSKILRDFSKFFGFNPVEGGTRLMPLDEVVRQIRIFWGM